MAQDFIDEMQAEAKLRFGKELSPEEAAQKFMGHDAETRIFHLKNLQTPDEMTVTEAAKRYPYESALRQAHFKSLRVDR